MNETETPSACGFAPWFNDVLIAQVGEVQTSEMVTTTRSAQKALADLHGGPGQPPWKSQGPIVFSSQQVKMEKSCFGQFPGSFWESAPVLSPPTSPSTRLSFLVVTLTGKKPTLSKDPGLLVCQLMDKIAALTAFYLTLGFKRLSETVTLSCAKVERDVLVRMQGRLLGGPMRGPRPQVPGSWHCSSVGEITVTGA